MAADFVVQLVKCAEYLPQDLTTARRQSIHARAAATRGFGRAKPTAVRHPREHRVQRARAQTIAVAMQFFQHPLTVDPLLARVVKDMHLPESEEELTNHRIAHGGASYHP